MTAIEGSESLGSEMDVLLQNAISPSAIEAEQLHMGSARYSLTNRLGTGYCPASCRVSVEAVMANSRGGRMYVICTKPHGLKKSDFRASLAMIFLLAVSG